MKNLKYFFAAFLFLGFMGMGTNASAQNTDVKKPRKVSKAKTDYPVNQAKTKHVGDDGHSNEADKKESKMKAKKHPGNDGHAKAADKDEGKWAAKEARKAKQMSAKAKAKQVKKAEKAKRKALKAKAKTRR